MSAIDISDYRLFWRGWEGGPPLEDPRGPHHSQDTIRPSSALRELCSLAPEWGFDVELLASPCLMDYRDEHQRRRLSQIRLIAADGRLFASRAISGQDIDTAAGALLAKLRTI